MYKQYSSLNALFIHTHPEDQNPCTSPDSLLSSTSSLPTRQPPPNTPENGLEDNKTERQASIDTLIEPLSAALTSAMPSNNSPPDSGKSIAGLFGFIPVRLGSPRAPPDTDNSMQESTEGAPTSLVSSTGSWVQVQSPQEEPNPLESSQFSSIQPSVSGSKDSKQTTSLDSERLNQIHDRLQRIEATQISQAKELTKLTHLLTNPLPNSPKNNSDQSPDPPKNHPPPSTNPTKEIHKSRESNRPSSLKLTSLSLPNLSSISPPPSPLKIGNPDSTPATPPFTALRPVRSRVPSSLDLSLPEKRRGVTTAVSTMNPLAVPCGKFTAQTTGNGNEKGRFESYLEGLKMKERERDDGSGRVLEASVYEGWKRKANSTPLPLPLEKKKEERMDRGEKMIEKDIIDVQLGDIAEQTSEAERSGGLGADGDGDGDDDADLSEPELGSELDDESERANSIPYRVLYDPKNRTEFTEWLNGGRL